MQSKQGFNGNQGEIRTKAILSKKFICNDKSVDIDGTDIEIEFPPENGKLTIKDRILIRGRIQAKYFENNNEVKIAKEYVIDEDGIRTEFFAFLHTDQGDDETYFFFTAKEIVENFRLRPESKSNKENYIFSLSKDRQFESFKNAPKIEINRRIEEGLTNTEEHTNQKYLQRIEIRYKNPIKQIEVNNNRELFQRVKDKHIADKLFIAFNEFNDFRCITSWRIIDKISFKDTNYYNQFSFRTTNKETLSFFENIDISDKVVIKNKDFFADVTEAKFKVNKIIEVLNQNLIIHLVDINKNKSYKISKKSSLNSDCLDCQLNRFELNKINLSLIRKSQSSNDLWENMQYAYVLFNLGNYEKSKKLLLDICEKSKEEHQDVIYFFAKYNLRSIAHINWESEYPDMDVELSNLALSDEKKHILRSISSHSLFNDYSKRVDEIYLKIKDYKERKVVNDTAKLINELEALLAEYYNFTEGNRIFINTSVKYSTLVEKAIESCIISYSFSTLHSYHLKYLDDFWVQMAVHYCDPNKLLSYFQRNGVQNVPYKPSSDYFEHLITSFFEKENVDFLQSEINYFDNKTKNPDLRRKIERVFENICILLAYLDYNFKTTSLFKQILYFLKKIDLRIHNFSSLAHPLIKKPEIFEANDLVDLVNILISNDKFLDGYLLTNCLLILKEKGFIFTNDENYIIEKLNNIALSKSQYGILKVLPYVLPEKEKQELLKNIQDSLNNMFNADLFYEAVLNDCLEKPHSLMSKYLKFYKELPKLANESNIHWGRSPYTGVSERVIWEVKKLIEILIILNEKDLLQNKIVKEIKQLHPYYDFILNIENYIPTDEFNINWLLEIQTEIIFKKIANNKKIKNILHKELNENYHKELGHIFIKYFSS